MGASSDFVQTTKFLVDAPLGHLARWLRMIGYDTKYSSHSNREDLIEIARSDKRTTITISKISANILTNNDIQVIHLLQGKIIDYLKQLKNNDIVIKVPRITDSRCSVCNGRLRIAKSSHELEKIPPNSKQFYDEFYVCVDCEKLFWEGSHWDKIKMTINEVKQSN